MGPHQHLGFSSALHLGSPCLGTPVVGSQCSTAVTFLSHSRLWMTLE